MRVVLSVGLIALVLAASAFIAAQPRNETKSQAAKPPVEKEVDAPPKSSAKPAATLTSREILARLQLEIDAKPYQEKVKFHVILEDILNKLQAADRAVTINVDVEAYVAIVGADAPNPLEEPVGIYGTHRKRVKVIDLLSEVVKQIAKGSAILIRAGRVDIVPVGLTTKEYMLNQTFRADFKEQRLDLALEELGDLTGVSLVIDGRARQKAQTAVTARFQDDVALQDAVRMLTEMADLKIVHLVTGIYVTTPENAKVMQKELKQIYDAPAILPVFPGGLTPQLGGPSFMDRPESPLTPPLPPAPRRRGPEAAS